MNLLTKNLRTVLSISRHRCGSIAIPQQPAQLLPVSARCISFIDVAKTKGANALLGKFLSSDRFDRTMDGLTVASMEGNRVTCELEVHDGIANAYGTLHGGAVSTLVDIVGTLAILAQHPTSAGVSVELNVSFLAAAKVGEKVIITGQYVYNPQSIVFI